MIFLVFKITRKVVAILLSSFAKIQGTIEPLFAVFSGFAGGKAFVTSSVPYWGFIVPRGPQQEI